MHGEAVWLRSVCGTTALTESRVVECLTELKLQDWLVGGKTKRAINTNPAELDRLCGLYCASSDFVTSTLSQPQSQGTRIRNIARGRVKTAGESISSRDYSGLE